MAKKKFRMVLVKFLLAVTIGFFAMEILNPPPVLNLHGAVSLLVIFLCGAMLGLIHGKRK